MFNIFIIIDLLRLLWKNITDNIIRMKMHCIVRKIDKINTINFLRNYKLYNFNRFINFVKFAFNFFTLRMT